MNALTIASLGVTYLTTFVAWGFVVLYHVVSKGAWRRDAMGWHIMAITAVDALIFSMLSVAAWLPALAASRVYQWVYIGMVAGIPAVTVWRGVILWQLYRRLQPGAAAPVSTSARPRWPLPVWQIVLGCVQVLNGTLAGGWRVALLVGAVQLGLACFAYGRGQPAAASST